MSSEFFLRYLSLSHRDVDVLRSAGVDVVNSESGPSITDAAECCYECCTEVVGLGQEFLRLLWDSLHHEHGGIE